MISQKAYLLIISFLFFIAIALRAYGIWFPLWGFDEEQNFEGGLYILKSLLHFINPDMPPPKHDFVSIYGTVGKYLAVIPVALGFAIEKILPLSYPIPIALIFTRIFISLIPNILTIYYTQKIANVFRAGRFVQILVVLLFLFTFKHIETARYAVSDSLSTFFAVLSLYYLLKYWINNTNITKLSKSIVLTAITASCKINVGGIVFLCILFVLFFSWKRAGFKQHFFVEHVVKKMGLFLFVFFVINLPYFVHFQDWYTVLYNHIYHYPYIHKGGWTTFFYFNPPFGVGLPILFLSIIGMTYFIYQYKFMPLLLFICFFYIYLSLSRGVIHRWAIPMIPFLVVLSACFLDILKEKIQQQANKNVAMLSVFVICLGIGGLPFWESAKLAENIGNQGLTYQKAVDYVQQNFPNHRKLIHALGVRLEGASYDAPSIQDLARQTNSVAIINDFWLAERHYPKEILHINTLHNRTDGNWLPAVQYIEQHWQLEKIIRPKYYTNWSTHIANDPPIYIYVFRTSI